MAATGTIAVKPDLCDIVRGWQTCARHGEDVLVTTHCQLPNGSLLKVRMRPAGDGLWIVSDGGAAFDEAIYSGIEAPTFNLNVRRAIRSKGLSFVDGRIESPRVDTASLFTASVIVANTARDVAEALLILGARGDEQSLEQRAREALVAKFHTWVLSKPLTISGASERLHKFDTALSLPDGRRVLIDVVKHQGNSINSTIVANMDVRRLGDESLVQRIVFDPEENWKPEEIALLKEGATPVALPGLISAIERIAA